MVIVPTCLLLAASAWPIEPWQEEAPPALEHFQAPPNRASLAITGGAFSVLEEEQFFHFNAEYRFKKYAWNLRPILGFSLVEGGATYTYAGIRFELPLTDRLAFTPSFAAGAFEDSPGVDLGGTLEFRTALELDYKISRAVSLGAIVAHYSNAGLYEHNSGSESVSLGLIVDVLQLLD